MKKILCLLLALLMLMSIVSCTQTPDNNEDTTSPEAIGGKVDAEKYDGVFKVGYATVDISYTEDEMPFTKK